MSAESVRSEIKGICSIDYMIDQEQVLDIILARGENNTGDKEADYRAVTSSWTRKEWHDTVKEFYNTYEKAELSKFFYEEITGREDYRQHVEAQRTITPYKSAPDYYYLSLAVREMQPAQEVAGPQPQEEATQMVYSTTETNVLCAVYAAVSCGETYGSACYPPQVFIDQVMGGGLTSSEFYAVCCKMMNKKESFEKIIIEMKNLNKAQVRKMVIAYKDLVGRKHLVNSTIDAVTDNKVVRGVARGGAKLGKQVAKTNRAMKHMNVGQVATSTNPAQPAPLQQQQVQALGQQSFLARLKHAQPPMAQPPQGYGGYAMAGVGRNQRFAMSMRHQSPMRTAMNFGGMLFNIWVGFLLVMTLWAFMLNFKAASQIMDVNQVTGWFGVLAKIPLIGWLARIIVAFASWIRPCLCLCGLVGALGLKQWRLCCAIPFSILIMPALAIVGTAFCVLYFVKTITVIIGLKTLSLAIIAPRVL